MVRAPSTREACAPTRGLELLLRVQNPSAGRKPVSEANPWMAKETARAEANVTIRHLFRNHAVKYPNGGCKGDDVAATK